MYNSTNCLPLNVNELLAHIFLFIFWNYNHIRLFGANVILKNRYITLMILRYEIRIVKLTLKIMNSRLINLLACYKAEMHNELVKTSRYLG